MMDGIGHAGQRTASSPGEVPLIPVELYDRPPRFTILMWRHMRSVRRKALYRSFRNIESVNWVIQGGCRTYVDIGRASSIGYLFNREIVVVE